MRGFESSDGSVVAVAGSQLSDGDELDLEALRRDVLGDEEEERRRPPQDEHDYLADGHVDSDADDTPPDYTPLWDAPLGRRPPFRSRRWRLRDF